MTVVASPRARSTAAASNPTGPAPSTIPVLGFHTSRRCTRNAWSIPFSTIDMGSSRTPMLRSDFGILFMKRGDST